MWCCSYLESTAPSVSVSCLRAHVAYGAVTTPNLDRVPCVTDVAECAVAIRRSGAVSPAAALLPARACRVRLRLVHERTMIEITDAPRDVVNELRHTTELIVVEVLRLVRHLVVVAMPARGEEHDRNAVARVHVVIAAAIDVLRMTVGVERVVERESRFLFRVHILDEIAKLRREPTRADDLYVTFVATVQELARLSFARNVRRPTATDHVDVELHDDGIAWHGRMVGEVTRA